MAHSKVVGSHDAEPATTMTADGNGARPSLERVRLVVVAGVDRGKAFELARGTALVGTHSDCHLALTDRGVSRRHLSVELHEQGVRVVDLGSKNGTRFLGATLDSLDLPVGGTLELGPSTSLTIVPIVGREVTSERVELGQMVGASLSMRHLFALIERVAPTDTTCLLFGETGTGKELAARTLHERSSRAAGPFVVVECGALSSELATATLFGHVRGAFTGAVSDSAGLVGAADGGTLFLDEVSALPLELQPLLLRVLESRTFQRVGDTQQRRSNFRLLASTRVDLVEAIAAGRFRADLYYRLSPVVLELPALRERRDDLPLLVRRFADAAQVPLSVSHEVMAAASSWHWPGNVRELKNAVEASGVLGHARSDPQARTPTASVDFHTAKERVVTSFERGYLEELLKKHTGNLVAVAREAGIGRSHLYRLLEAHHLDADAFR